MTRRTRLHPCALTLFVVAALGVQGTFSPRGHAQRRLAEQAEGFLENCQWLDKLPEDLSSHEDSDLSRYGEMQDISDGSLDLHGLSFRVPSSVAGQARDLTTGLQVLQPSVLKVKCASNEPGVQCEVTVSEEGREVVDGEDRLSHVNGRAGTVLLPAVGPAREGDRQHLVIRLSFSVPRQAEDCIPFEFMLQMRPISSVNDELRCPPTLPAMLLPPRKFTVGSEGSDLPVAVDFSSDQLLLTPDKLHEHSSQEGSFMYPMSIHVRGSAATISAQVSFDWILGDFELQLARIDEGDLAGSSGHVLVRSNQTEAEDADAQFERSAKVWASVAAGNYRLLLQDKTAVHLQARAASASTLEHGGDSAIASMCVPFAFSIDAVPVGSSQKRFKGLMEAKAGAERGASETDKEDGILVSVQPATAHNLDPTQPLRLVLSFSAPVARFGKEDDGTRDAGVGGEEGAAEVQCSNAQHAKEKSEQEHAEPRDEWSDWKKLAAPAGAWAASQLCSEVFTLRPTGAQVARGPSTQGPPPLAPQTALTPQTVYLREGATPGAAAAKVVVTFRPEALVEGVDYQLHIDDGYLRTVAGDAVSVQAHNGGLHSYRTAACDCHGHGRCDAERRCACAAGYAGAGCERCSEGHRLQDDGKCRVVEASMVCSHESCNGHGSVSIGVGGWSFGCGASGLGFRVLGFGLRL
jgi:hypothetical protein